MAIMQLVLFRASHLATDAAAFLVLDQGGRLKATAARSNRPCSASPHSAMCSSSCTPTARVPRRLRHPGRPGSGVRRPAQLTDLVMWAACPLGEHGLRGGKWDRVGG